MLQSKLFGKTTKDAPKDEVSINAVFLSRGGFIDKLSAGVYSYLPLGLRTLKKIQQIVREEMNAIDGQEILMPALHPKEVWEQTGRWHDPGSEVMFQFKGRSEKEYGLGWTHEEVVTPLAKRFISSYRDLPLALYQIQDKFRNEPRAKSGLMRGIEFSMKDLYSFHADQSDLDVYYEKALNAYRRVYERCGLDAIVTEASGGSFSKYSHEFQVLTPNGEDIIYYCQSCKYAQNKEIAELQGGDTCPKCKKGTIGEGKAIEVGNIFQLKTKYSEPFKLEFAAEDGSVKQVLMGCYGIGPSRVMGSIVEVHHDDRGIVWPKSVAPFAVHLLRLGENETVTKRAQEVYEKLMKAGVEVLYDDRADISAGQKFADADLIGLPIRAVISEKAGKDVEVKKRSEAKATLVSVSEFIALVS